MDTTQRVEIERALMHWPGKTTISWDNCPATILARCANIQMPRGTKSAELFSQLEKFYGLPPELLNRLVNNSLKFWKSSGKRSHEQKAMLQEFLQLPAPTADLVDLLETV